MRFIAAVAAVLGFLDVPTPRLASANLLPNVRELASDHHTDAIEGVSTATTGYECQFIASGLKRRHADIL